MKKGATVVPAQDTEPGGSNVAAAALSHVLLPPCVLKYRMPSDFKSSIITLQKKMLHDLSLIYLWYG